MLGSDAGDRPHVRRVVRPRSARPCAAEVATPEVDAEIAALEERVGDRQLIVRIDRMELSKNIVRGFLAYDLLLEEHPELRERVTFAALLNPSRESLPEYLAYRNEVEQAAAQVNERWATPGWEPVILDQRDNYARSLAGLVRSDVLLVNPVRDGLNLIALEGPLANRRDGVLCLSREAGAHDELAARVPDRAALRSRADRRVAPRSARDGPGGARARARRSCAPAPRRTRRRRGSRPSSGRRTPDRGCRARRAAPRARPDRRPDIGPGHQLGRRLRRLHPDAHRVREPPVAGEPVQRVERGEITRRRRRRRPPPSSPAHSSSTTSPLSIGTGGRSSTAIFAGWISSPAAAAARAAHALAAGPSSGRWRQWSTTATPSLRSTSTPGSSRVGGRARSPRPAPGTARPADR